MIPAERFYAPNEGAPKQGDILLAAVTRLVAEDRFTPQGWERLDSYDVTLRDASAQVGDLRLTVGPALVMITSHDCHFDKEWNARRSRLIREGVSPAEAAHLADEDPTLDRAFNACPLLLPSEVDRDRKQLMDGKIVGYLPVPASPDGLIPQAVADLRYRVTLDRLDDIHRVACASAEARAQLRYALARLESLRASTVGFDVESVLGRAIERVSFPKTNPLTVQLTLDDGGAITLLQQPVELDQGPAREQPPGADVSSAKKVSPAAQPRQSNLQATPPVPRPSEPHLPGSDQT